MTKRIYVITGASSGIGRALVERLSKENLVFAGYRSEVKGKELGELSDNIIPFYVDYAKPETIAEMILVKLDEHAVVSNERTFPYELKVALYAKDNTCAICGQTILSIKDAHVDHIVPWSKGGTTTIDNAQLTHIHCNCSKGNRTYEEEFEAPKKKKKGIFNFGK
jgi:hypothetical protein